MMQHLRRRPPNGLEPRRFAHVLVNGVGRTTMASGIEPAKQVLLVEAEVTTRTIAADKLRDAGLRVVEAASTVEADAYLRRGEPVALILRDVQVLD